MTTTEEPAWQIALAREAHQAAAEADQYATAGNGHDSTSWEQVDLAKIIAGGITIAPPDILTRDDGIGLLYRGRLNGFYGEPESGKSWLAQIAAAQQLTAGRRVLYLDFEDTPEALTARLRALAVDDQALLELFDYRNPDRALNEHAVATLTAGLAARPALVVLDGVTEAMGLHDLDGDKNRDVARFRKLLTRRLTATGAAAVTVDHVTKNTENRGSYAIGAQHKKAVIDGAAYSVDIVTPFGRGRTGRAEIRVQKDKGGHVRQHANGKVVAELTVAADPDGTTIQTTLAAPTYTTTASGFRPTTLMEKISRCLEHQGDAGFSKRAVKSAVGGKTDAKDLAIELLVTEGYVEVAKEGATHLHFSAQPYRSDSDPKLTTATPE